MGGFGIRDTTYGSSRLGGWLAVCLTAFLACTPAPAPADSPVSDADPRVAAVTETVQELFDAMRARDGAAIDRLLAPGAILTAIDADSITAPRHTSGEQFVERFATQGPELVERFWDPEVRIEGRLAMVWTPYDFHRDGEFSHCGIDAFHLAHDRTRWVITSIAYTVQREGCASSR